ncbi:MAG TPA: hypothetical protein VGY96_00655 [Streptosporangiaceae bacterium]|jgi:hypothetical protein|nr:hypothetical protein [Streptosporangiaceae bacterium]
MSTDFPEQRDNQRPSDGDPQDHEPAEAGGLLSNLTLTIGSLMLKCKLEIERIEAGPSVAKEAQARPRIRDELRRIVRLASSGSSLAFPSGLRSTPAQGQHSRSDPAGYGQDGSRHSEYLVPHPRPLIGENCTIILSDVVGFGSRTRTDEDRRVIREALYSLTHTALQDLPDVWSWDDRGDGLLTVVPPSVPTAEVIAHLHKELPAAVEEHNRAHREPARIRLRVAINVGPVTTDTMGVTGEAIIVTARLVEAPLFKEAMDKAQASLGVIASTFIYESVIRHDLGLTGYSQIRVDVKESSMAAWMKLFDRSRSSP